MFLVRIFAVGFDIEYSYHPVLQFDRHNQLRFSGIAGDYIAAILGDVIHNNSLSCLRGPAHKASSQLVPQQVFIFRIIITLGMNSIKVAIFLQQVYTYRIIINDQLQSLGNCRQNLILLEHIGQHLRGIDQEPVFKCLFLHQFAQFRIFICQREAVSQGFEKIDHILSFEAGAVPAVKVEVPGPFILEEQRQAQPAFILPFQFFLEKVIPDIIFIQFAGHRHLATLVIEIKIFRIQMQLLFGTGRHDKNIIRTSSLIQHNQTDQISIGKLQRFLQNCRNQLTLLKGLSEYPRSLGEESQAFDEFFIYLHTI